MLVKKYRPKKFLQVVAQKAPVQVLRNAIKFDRVSSTYLFFGPFGTGKTSLARVFAMALNCLKLEEYEPCGECISCKEIINGSSRQVLEFDAASSRDVDSMDILKEIASYEVESGKYKVIILDECHMLSKAAQASLLKLLEEPPKNVVFMLVTTDPADLSETIRSRSTTLQFRQLTTVEIADTLRLIAYEEGVKIGEKELYLIARNSSGALRDAEKVLDVAMQMEDHSVDSIANLLGVMTREDMGLIADIILTGDLGYFSSSIIELQSKGYGVDEIFNAFVIILRDMVCSKIDRTGIIQYDSMIPWKSFVEHVNLSLGPLMKMLNNVLSRRKPKSLLELEMYYLSLIYESGMLEVADGVQ